MRYTPDDASQHTLAVTVLRGWRYTRTGALPMYAGQTVIMKN
jgi:hypothetical protein